MSEQMNYIPDSASTTKKSTDSGYSIHESISSNDYESDSNSSDSFTCNDDNDECKQLASVIVNDLIARALRLVDGEELPAPGRITDNQHQRLSADQLSSNDSNLHVYLPPAIQIDLIGSKTPSPDSVACVWTNSIENEKADIDQQSSPSSVVDDTVAPVASNECQRRESLKRAGQDLDVNLYPREKIQDDDLLREFARDYVKSIIETALEMALVRSVTKTSLSEEYSRRGATGPWYLRIRQVFSRLMRSACLCKAKQEFNRHRKT